MLRRHLSITKTHGGTPAVGGRTTYTMTVSNNGPTDDPGPITVKDVLPAGLSYVKASGDGWVCSAAGQTVTCTRAAGLALKKTSAIALTVTVLPAAYPTVINTAVVSTRSEETDDSNNTATDPAQVTPLSDLALVKTLGAVDGTTVNWSIKVTNEGPNPAVGPITVADNLPAGLAYVSAAGPGWVCAVAGQLITCTYAGSLGVGHASSIQVTTTVTRAAASTATTITNGATVTAPHDPNQTNNTGSANYVLPPAGVAPPTNPSAPPGGGGNLPNTGFGVTEPLLAALLLMLLGAGLIFVGRGRRRTE